MRFNDWNANPPRGRNNKRLAWVEITPADFALIQRTAAFRKMSMQKLVAEMVEPELSKLRDTDTSAEW